MAEGVAPTVFNTGPTNSVAVADVYETKKIEPVNNQPASPIKDSAIKAAETLKAKTNLKDLADITTIKDGKASISSKDAKDKVNAIIGGPNSPLNDLTNKGQDFLLEKFGFTSDKELAAAAEGKDGNVVKTKKGWQTVSGIKVLYNNIQAIRNFDPKSAGDVAKLLNGLSGNSELAKVLDLESQFTVLGTIMQKVSELGIPDAIDMILAKLASDEERRRLIIENIRQFVMNSDIYTLNKAYQYVGGPGILSRVPDFVNLLMMFYRYPVGNSKPTGPMLTALKGILDLVSPNWHLYNRNGNNIINLEPFTYASPDAIAVFAQDPNFIIQTRIASFRISPPYRNRELIGMITEGFPYINLTPPNIYKNIK